MMPLKDFKTAIKGDKIHMGIRFLNRRNIDFDVYLQTRKINLQRDFVWSYGQKSEFIKSVFLGRTIPYFSFYEYFENDLQREGVIQVIDGKQRLSTLFDFLNNKLSVDLFADGNSYLLSDLSSDYQTFFKFYTIPVNIVYENVEIMNDNDKINWFINLNYTGVQQEKERLKVLKRI